MARFQVRTIHTDHAKYLNNLPAAPSPSRTAFAESIIVAIAKVFTNVEGSLSQAMYFTRHRPIAGRGFFCVPVVLERLFLVSFVAMTLASSSEHTMAFWIVRP